MSIILKEIVCTCKYTGSGKVMITAGCITHTKISYACDCCECDNYRPKSEPIASKNGGKHWPLCTCGHIAQEHS